MLSETYLIDIRKRFDSYKALAEGAMGQINDHSFFEVRGQESNSVAIIVKHLAGNLRSRWTDFLTSDGQKPDRKRDSEFTCESGETRTSLMEGWETAWAVLGETLLRLEGADLTRTVTIRQEPHIVVEAINRSLAHTAYHVGQIVQLARDSAGPRWQTLSIARGESDPFDADMDRKFAK